jgi:putative RNA 2'-phosphotransferase
MSKEKAELESTSKFLSLVLRHKPEQIGLSLDSEGWASIDELVNLANAAGQPLDRMSIEVIVAMSDKQRFALSQDGRRIRANQGHSINVSLGLEPKVPPDQLYHGTASRFLASIQMSGLNSAQRLQVHLSSDATVAQQVGARHGRAIVLIVNAKAMSAAGHLFYLSQNGVWLTKAVPPQYIRLLE